MSTLIAALYNQSTSFKLKSFSAVEVERHFTVKGLKMAIIHRARHLCGDIDY